jgi:hypothetical protein
VRGDHGEANGDRGVDGVTAVFENFDTDIRAVRFHRDNHSIACVNGLAGA